MNRIEKASIRAAIWSAMATLLLALVVGAVGYDAVTHHWLRHAHRASVLPPQHVIVAAKVPAPAPAAKPVPVPQPAAPAKVLPHPVLAKAAAPKAPRPRRTRAAAMPAVPPLRKDVIWKNWGAAPFASSFAEACRKTPMAIDASSLPEPVKSLLKQKIGSDCEGGEVRYLPPEQRLEQMWSGGTHDSLLNGVTVAKLPVAKAPSGRAYRANSVFETPRARAWRVDYGGQQYVWVIPDVCFNDAWFVLTTPSGSCVELSFNAYPGGYVRWGIGTREPLPPDACNAQREDSGSWVAWWGECESCIPAINYIRSILGQEAQVFQKYFYPVRVSRQTLRFSTEIWKRVVYICLQAPDGAQTCGVYMRPQDWKGRYHVNLPDSLWRKDNGDCPQ